MSNSIGFRTHKSTYISWSAMRKRCRHIAHYTERGIVVCKRWNSFANFLLDMGDRPEGMTIERKNNNGNYEPGNCVWDTPKSQARNRRNNVLISFGGKKLPLSQVCELSGIARETLQYRIDIGRKDLFSSGIRATKKEMKLRHGTVA